MTPEERRELAERLDRAAALNERTAKVMGSLGRGWANTAADLRAAAAALREDAAPNLIGVEDVMAVHGRDALADTIRERDAARAEVERLRAGIERHRRAVRNGVPGLNGTPNRDLWALLDTEGGTDE